MRRQDEIRNSELLRNLIYKGARDKKIVLTDIVSARIEHEFSIIEEKGFTNHFILYSRIIEACDELKLIRSCGRGRSINSMVNYCLDVIKVDPIEHNLKFENFVSPEQTNLPDIDIDVPYGYRTKVINKLKQKYPEYHVYPIAVSTEKNSSKFIIHPCGVIINQERLTDSIVVHEGQECYRVLDVYNNPIFTNYKVDILELMYLNRLQLIANEVSDEHHPYKLSLDNKQVFDFFATGDMENIFIFDSPDFNQILAQSKPQSFSDLSKINLIIHPKSSIVHSLSYSILGYWGCFYKTHFRKEFEMVFSKELS